MKNKWLWLSLLVMYVMFMGGQHTEAAEKAAYNVHIEDIHFVDVGDSGHDRPEAYGHLVMHFYDSKGTEILKRTIWEELDTTPREIGYYGPIDFQIYAADVQKVSFSGLVRDDDGDNGDETLYNTENNSYPNRLTPQQVGLSLSKLRLQGEEANVSYIDIQNMSVTPASEITQEKKYMVMTSDPQYPWTDRTDSNQPEDDSTQAARSESLITEQYNNINKFAGTIDNTYTKVPIFVNGDITAYGHQWQINKMNQLFKILKNKIYVGLGNHDIENNQDDCAGNSCIFNTVSNYYDTMSRSDVDDFDFTKNTFMGPDGAANNTYQGSLAYSKDFGSLHMVQLNNYPTMTYSSGVLNNKLYIYSTLDWLAKDLQKASANHQNIILNLHEPSGWATGADSTFKNLINQYHVKAIFAGHYHTTSGSYSGGKDYFGDIPVFLSGSASQRTYLINEFTGNNLAVYKVKENDYTKKQKVTDVPLIPHEKVDAYVSMKLKNPGENNLPANDSSDDIFEFYSPQGHLTASANLTDGSSVDLFKFFEFTEGDGTDLDFNFYNKDLTFEMDPTILKTIKGVSINGDIKESDDLNEDDNISGSGSLSNFKVTDLGNGQKKYEASGTLSKKDGSAQFTIEFTY